MATREQGVSPLTEQDLLRVDIYTKMVGLDYLTRTENDGPDGIPFALFAVYRKGKQNRELGLCFKCPCNAEKCWIGRVLKDSPHPHLDALHFTGTRCDSPGFKEEATRIPFTVLTKEEWQSLLEAFPNSSELSQVFDLVNRK